MKKFVKSWNASVQKRKQRKYRFNAPLHVKHKLMAANLSKELRKRYGRRSLSLRKGDVAKVRGGEFKGRSGKILFVQQKKLRVYIEGLQKMKRDGTKVNVLFRPWNLQITELNLDDKKRVEKLAKKESKQKKEKIAK